MIPLWMFPLAISAGNTFVLKPSEKDPGAAVLLAEMAKEAGVPDGRSTVREGTWPRDWGSSGKGSTFKVLSLLLSKLSQSSL